MAKQRVIIFLGPPGVGKGTQANELSRFLKLPHISTGDLFREHLKQKTSFGEKVKGFLDKGHLVPDDLVLEMLFDRISQKDCKRGFILDGFPRTVEQAKALATKVDEKNVTVLNLELNDEEIIKRLGNRLTCKNCSATYHKIFMPPKIPFQCDKCNGELIQRKDDTEEVIKERLLTYKKQTEPTIEYYKNTDINFFSISGDTSKEKIFAEILKIVK